MEFVSWDYCSHLMESQNPFMFQSPPTRYGSVTKKMGKPRSCFASFFRNSGNLPVLKHPTSCGLEYNIIYPLVMTNIAMEDGPFIDALPIQNGDFPWQTVSHYQRVYPVPLFGVSATMFHACKTKKLQVGRPERPGKNMGMSENGVYPQL